MKDKSEGINGSFTSLGNFSSTANLTPSQQTENEQKAVEYDPFAHRKVDKPTSDFGTLTHLLKGSLGSGLLAMPLAFKNGGLTFGVIMTLVIGYVCTHCVQMLVDSSHMLCRRAKIPMLDFAGTAYVAFQNGPPKLKRFASAARTVTKVSLCVTYFMGITTNVVFVASTIKKIVVEDNLIQEWAEVDTRVYIVMLWIPLLLISTIKDLKYLVPFSTVANLCLVAVFGITMYYILDEIKDPRELRQMGTIAELPTFFSTVLFAIEGIGVVMPLENQMKTPQHFTGCPGVLNTAMSFSVVLYAITGFFGYLRFGDVVEGTITLNLNNTDAAAKACQYFITTAVFLSYALQSYVPTTIIWDSIKHRFPESKHLRYYYLMRAILVTGTVCLGAAIPNLGPIIGLVGAVCFSILGLTFPSIIHLATRYQIGYGKYQWIIWKNIVIIILSILALVFGSYTSILDIIDAYSGKET